MEAHGAQVRQVAGNAAFWEELGRAASQAVQLRVAGLLCAQADFDVELESALLDAVERSRARALSPETLNRLALSTPRSGSDGRGAFVPANPLWTRSLRSPRIDLHLDVNAESPLANSWKERTADENANDVDGTESDCSESTEDRPPLKSWIPCPCFVLELLPGLGSPCSFWVWMCALIVSVVARVLTVLWNIYIFQSKLARFGIIVEKVFFVLAMVATIPITVGISRVANSRPRYTSVRMNNIPKVMRCAVCLSAVFALILLALLVITRREATLLREDVVPFSDHPILFSILRFSWAVYLLVVATFTIMFALLWKLSRNELDELRSLLISQETIDWRLMTRRYNKLDLFLNSLWCKGRFGLAVSSFGVATFSLDFLFIVGLLDGVDYGRVSSTVFYLGCSWCGLTSAHMLALLLLLAKISHSCLSTSRSSNSLYGAALQMTGEVARNDRLDHELFLQRVNRKAAGVEVWPFGTITMGFFRYVFKACSLVLPALLAFAAVKGDHGTLGSKHPDYPWDAWFNRSTD
eukprot:TRINITY_DN29005_c1_g1_i1.p1 TRINITY_DN29005_c1_g1~~TRINITY_DN29005_c1_g1_i1.p1  ORF type:complete len:541 (+),score=32.83 TRINITY_DN29005_c1_g1_i1:51-1625(+)